MPGNPADFRDLEKLHTLARQRDTDAFLGLGALGIGIPEGKTAGPLKRCPAFLWNNSPWTKTQKIQISEVCANGFGENKAIHIRGHTIAADTVACLSGITSSLPIGEDARTQAAAREKAAPEPTDKPEYVCFEHQYRRGPAPSTAVSNRDGCSKSCNLRKTVHAQEYGRKLSTGEPIANFARLVSRDRLSTEAEAEEIQAPVNTVARMSGITPSFLIGEDARTQASVREESSGNCIRGCMFRTPVPPRIGTLASGKQQVQLQRRSHTQGVG